MLFVFNFRDTRRGLSLVAFDTTGEEPSDGGSGEILPDTQVDESGRGTEGSAGEPGGETGDGRKGGNPNGGVPAASRRGSVDSDSATETPRTEGTPRSNRGEQDAGGQGADSALEGSEIEAEMEAEARIGDLRRKASEALLFRWMEVPDALIEKYGDEIEEISKLNEAFEAVQQEYLTYDDYGKDGHDPHKTAEWDALRAAKNQLEEKVKRELRAQALSGLMEGSVEGKEALSGVKVKRKKVKVSDFVSKDKGRKHLTGVYHHDGRQTATDTYTLVDLDAKYDKGLEGKIVDKKGNEIEGTYIAIDKIFNQKGLTPISLDIKDALDVAQRMSAAAGSGKTSTAYVVVDGIPYDAHRFAKALQVADEYGLDKARQSGVGILVIEGSRGRVAIMGSRYEDIGGRPVYDLASGRVSGMDESAKTEYSVGGSIDATPEQRAIGEALADIMRDAGIEVVEDTAEMERALGDEAMPVQRQKYINSGEVYGFVKDGKIYLDPQLMNANTPVHEYTHLWDKALQKGNPELWSRGKELLKQTPLWDEVVNDPAYADIAQDEDLVASEVHSRLSGEKGKEYLDRMDDAPRNNRSDHADNNGGHGTDLRQEAGGHRTLKERIKAWLGDALAWVRDAFSGKWGREDLAKLTVEEFAAMPIWDLARGVNPAVEERRASQAERVNETNPMFDDYHYGIRNMQDVKTFEEVLADAEQEYSSDGELAYPDLDIEDLRKAQKEGFDESVEDRLEEMNKRLEEIALEEETTDSVEPLTETLNELQSMWEELTNEFGENPENDEVSNTLTMIENAMRRWRWKDVTVIPEEGVDLDNPEESGKFAQTYTTKNGTTIKFESSNPEVYNEEGLWSNGNLFGFEEEGEDVPHGTGRKSGAAGRPGTLPVQRENRKLTATRHSDLNREEGEFCNVERIFRESGGFEFTAGEKITGPEDVAFIFEQLEDASVENAFAVFVKRGKPTVLHVGTGSFTMTPVNVAAIKEAYTRLKPDRVYFVHNHPSGKLFRSPEDLETLNTIEKSLGTEVTGIIMNLKSGKFGMFDNYVQSELDKQEAPENQTRLRVYSFDRYAFSKDFDPSKITTPYRAPADIASYISSHRLGNRNKISLLVFNRAKGIIGNIHTPYTRIDSSNIDELAERITSDAIVFGGDSVILYGDYKSERYGILPDLKKAVSEKSGKAIRLNDCIKVYGNNSWESAYNQGLLSEPGVEYGSKDGDLRFREVEDKKVLDEFAEGKTVKAYRTMQVIDGKLYSPMATKVGGKATPEIKLGVAEQAEEHPEIIKGSATGKDGKEYGTVTIDKGLGKGTLKVAYNPYIHASRTVLNDQFTSAHARPNLVTVEVEIPESELTSGYRAEKAKNAVGEMSWHSGSVSGKLSAIGNPRRVILSRYDRPLRIVPYREVAEKIAEQLKGTEISIPYNVVQPQVAEHLREMGVKVSEEASGTVGTPGDFGKAEYITDEQIAAPNEKWREMSDSSEEGKISRVRELSEKLHTPVRVVTEVKEIRHSDAKMQERMRNSKGWYDPATGEVVVVLPNHRDVEDVVETMFHETEFS